jgi:hypothetical protein
MKLPPELFKLVEAEAERICTPILRDMVSRGQAKRYCTELAEWMFNHLAKTDGECSVVLSCEGSIFNCKSEEVSEALASLRAKLELAESQLRFEHTAKQAPLSEQVLSLTLERDELKAKLNECADKYLACAGKLSDCADKLAAAELDVKNANYFKDMMREQKEKAEGEFKNFHRIICESANYHHDEIDWKRDQLSLACAIEKLRGSNV